MQYIAEYSPFINKKENIWMKSVIEIVRDTSLYFRPQIISNILNESWACYWHQELFINDKRLKTHETAFSKLDSGTTTFPKVGLNPYAFVELLRHIEEKAEKGHFTYEFMKIKNVEERKGYDKKTGTRREILFFIIK